MTLVCHHPELASNRFNYFGGGPSWAENGMGITPTTGIYLQTDTSEDLMNTTLNIDITVDHFRNRSFNYSCLLAVADKNRLPTGEVETSENEVNIDPVGECLIYLVCALNSSRKYAECPHHHHTQMYPFLPRLLQ